MRGRRQDNERTKAFFNSVPTPIARWNSDAKYATFGSGIV